MTGPSSRRRRCAPAAAALVAVLLAGATAGAAAFVVQPSALVSSSELGARGLSKQTLLGRGRPEGCGGKRRESCGLLPGNRGRNGRSGRLVLTSSLAAATTVGTAAAAVASVANNAAVTSPGGVGSSFASVGSFVTAAAPIFGSIGVLALVITLHEAGHLVAALSQGIRVETFSVGLGPKLLSYRSGGERGFFKGKLTGPSWDVVGRGWEVKRGEEGKVERVPVGRGKKSGTGKAGEPATREYEEGVEYTLRAIPVGGFVSFPNNYEVDEDGVVTEYDDPDLLYNRGPVSRGVVIAAGVVVNFMLAWACIFGSVTTSGIVKPHYSPGVVINQISDPKGGAAAAGFRPKDVFLSINGKALAGDSSSLETAVKTIRASEGKPIAVELARDGAKPVVRMVETAVGPSGKYTIGVLLAPHMESIERQKASNPFEAGTIAFKETAGLADKTLESFVHLASTGDAAGVSGPVEIVKVGASLANEDGAGALLQFAAVISVNLAVINSLPVPGLDGGQMVFVLAELVSRKKLERGVTEAINGVALLVLLGVSLSTFAGDLGIGALLQRIVSGAVR